MPLQWSSQDTVLCRRGVSDANDGVEEYQSNHRGAITHDDDEGDGDSEIMDDDDEINLEAYEDYRLEIKRQAASRPQSARVLRPYPTEAPEFYMVNVNNPVNPVNPVNTINIGRVCEQGQSDTRDSVVQHVATHPTRPMSARAPARPPARVVMPRAPQTARGALGGVRRKRQVSRTVGADGAAGDSVSARIRAVYSDVGRASTSAIFSPATGASGAPASTISVMAASAIQTKGRVFRPADFHDEHFKLVDTITELRASVQHEQERRIKAMARVRRLEEVVAMKDRKIDAMLQSRGSGNAGMSGGGGDTALRERQHHAQILRLRHKLAQQYQLVASYEEAMQVLRSSIKGTRLLELEQEQEQLHLEIQHLQRVVNMQRSELASQAQQSSVVANWEAQRQQQLTRLEHAQQRSMQDRAALEQEVHMLRNALHQMEGQAGKLARSRQRLPSELRFDDEARDGGVGDRGSDGESAASLAEALVQIKRISGPPNVKLQTGRPNIRTHALDPANPSNSASAPSPPASAGTNSASTSRPQGNCDPAIPISSVMKSPERPKMVDDRHVHWQAIDQEGAQEEIMSGGVQATHRNLNEALVDQKASPPRKLKRMDTPVPRRLLQDDEGSSDDAHTPDSMGDEVDDAGGSAEGGGDQQLNLSASEHKALVVIAEQDPARAVDYMLRYTTFDDVPEVTTAPSTLAGEVGGAVVTTTNDVRGPQHVNHAVEDGKVGEEEEGDSTADEEEEQNEPEIGTEEDVDVTAC